MKKNYFIFTNHQKALSFLAKFSDKEFYEREVAKNIGISNGSANKVLNDLFSNGLLARKQKGKMYFYRISLTNSILTQFKIFNSIALLHPLITELKESTRKIILYGSCAKGTETSTSDIDLFIISENRKRVLHIINRFSLGHGFEEIKIDPRAGLGSRVDDLNGVNGLKEKLKCLIKAKMNELVSNNISFIGYRIE